MNKVLVKKVQITYLKLMNLRLPIQDNKIMTPNLLNKALTKRGATSTF